jgi:flagellar motor switch protein FliM
VKPERSFVAERTLAQHCAELIRQDAGGLAPVDALPALARAGDKLVRGLAPAIAPLLGGIAPAITVATPVEGDLAALTAQIPALAANSLFACGPTAAPLLASVDAAAVLRIVDRTFGGKGQTPSPMPEAFPVSAEILIRRVESLIITGLADAFGLAAIEPIRRAGSLDTLEPFGETAPLAIQTLTVEEAGQTPWKIVIALPMATLGAIFGDCKAAPRTAVVARPINPTNEPFGDLPLTLSAVIVDMRMRMSALSGLRPGMMLPVSVARNVPLRIGEKTIGHGSIGAVDDRVAIQISHAF